MDPVSELEKRMVKTLEGLPRKIGSEVVNFALSNFSRQGFLGDRFQPWKPRKKVTKKNEGKAIGIQTGALRRSLEIISVGKDSVTVGSMLPYAKIFNDGFRGTVTVKSHSRITKTAKASKGVFSVKTRKERLSSVKGTTGITQVKSHSRKMNQPPRPFLGKSQYMEANIRRLIALEILKTANS